MAWFSDLKAMVKAKLKKLKKKQKKKKKFLQNRKLQIMVQHAKAHLESTRRRRQADQTLRRAFGRARVRERASPDKRLKKTAQEEQLWKLRSMTLKEKTRDRKAEAMRRWTMTATSGGAFRGR